MKWEAFTRGPFLGLVSLSFLEPVWMCGTKILLNLWVGPGSEVE